MGTMTYYQSAFGTSVGFNVGLFYTIAIIALVQAAGVSSSIPNPGGEYPDPSGDFRGQGAGNFVMGFFGGIPGRQLRGISTGLLYFSFSVNPVEKMIAMALKRFLDPLYFN